MSGRFRRPRAKAAPPPGTRWASDPPRRRAPWPFRGRRLSPSLSVRTLAAQVFLFQALIMLLLVAAGAAALVVQGLYDAERSAGQRSLAVAEAFAHAPGTAQALRAPDPTARLQPVAEQVRKGAGVDFVTVLDKHGVRLTDRRPDLIGTKAQGVGRALLGEAFTETFHGRPADAVRAVVPVTDPSRRVVGVVTAGIEYANVGDVLVRQLPALLGAAAGALVLATGGTALVSRRLLRQTHGLGPAEMTRMYEHHDAVLHAVREGVLILGGDGRVLLANDEARRLLDLPQDADRRQVRELGLGPGPTRLLEAGEAVSDEVVRSGDRLLAVNIRPTAPYGGAPGLVATFRDTTDLRTLSGQAELARGRLSFLYEAGMRIGTTLDVRRTAEELSEVAVPRMADFVTVELLDSVLRGEEPTSAVREMRRTALRGTHTGHPLQPVGEVIRFVMADTPMAAALRRGKAVLVPDLRTARDWRARDAGGAERVLDYGIHSLITVPLRARGVILGMADFWRGAGSPRFDEEDVAVTEELVARAAVAIDNARRYSREHEMAVTLQRSLLPVGLPEQDVLEIASRYLPARSGVGGDWFDVIPLPGFRVALVVGDIVGHGMQAAVTMGRLRTAVLNFSSLDLAPDELLGHLDEMVTRLDSQTATDDDRVPLTGATCLYAVYDPVRGRCAVSRAGHLAPAVVDPEGRVTFPDLPLSPPLGVGGHPFESGELELAEGSRLVLFTDGLIASRGRDVDEGLATLRAAVAHADRTPEETCRVLVERLLPERPSDDVALLVARTRLLDPSCVAAWDVPFDVTAVPRVRGEVSRRLADWGLAETAFATELILSELLTNALRYGAPPVRVRLLLGRTLVCEVSDGSNTSPRLRRAASTDEGGRGLFLVSQFADLWGTRYAARGKVIWAEQTLDRAAEPDPSLLFDVMGL
ncbi:SpoIIE family protein phosphatase [Streptomyces sp. NPDC017638]|uniref:SpoIIE family protein phosphatase n=1 Tax=Streptomyces sp. NPDC017638 TaxID=3365004 RepID=UPI0037A0B4A5